MFFVDSYLRTIKPFLCDDMIIHLLVYELFQFFNIPSVLLLGLIHRSIFVASVHFQYRAGFQPPETREVFEWLEVGTLTS